MTNQVETQLSDEKIVELAKRIDKFIVDTGTEFQTSGIELSAIALGRLMVFTQQVGAFGTFKQMLKTISMMDELPPEDPAE